MDALQPLPVLTHRKTHRVRGPRPCSWISSLSDSSSNEHREIWPWDIRGPGLRRTPTLRSVSSTESESSDFSFMSSSSSPLGTPKLLVEDDEKQRHPHPRRRKPSGPRPPRASSCPVRPKLGISTPLSVTRRLQPEDSLAMPPVRSADMPQSPQVPPFAVDSPTNFLLDWDVIFEILGCSEAFPGSAGSFQ